MPPWLIVGLFEIAAATASAWVRLTVVAPPICAMWSGAPPCGSDVGPAGTTAVNGTVVWLTCAPDDPDEPDEAPALGVASVLAGALLRCTTGVRPSVNVRLPGVASSWATL